MRKKLAQISIALIAIAVAVYVGRKILDRPPPVDFSGPLAGWGAYGGSAGGSRYSPLTQITRENVVIVAGGHGRLGTKLGDYVIAYSLPR